MSFDIWIHLVELLMVLGIAFTVWFTKKKSGKLRQQIKENGNLPE